MTAVTAPRYSFRKLYLVYGVSFWTVVGLLGLALSLLSGCAAHSNDLNTDVGTLQEGDRLAKDEFFDEARRQYLRIKTEFPQSALQVEAEMRIADSYYSEESYKAAASAYEDFIKTYPGRPEVPRALYRLAMSYLKQMPSTAQRDTRATAKVVDTFTRLLVDYPNSEYAKEAEVHIKEARNQLAEKIFEIGHFYERMGDYNSAARRFAELADQFADNPLAEKSLAREIVNLRQAGKVKEADEKTSAFLSKYPKSEYASEIK